MKVSRGVFATILIFITPSNPAAFWERRKLSLCEDIMHRDGTKVQPTEDEVNEALLNIQEQLERCNFSLADFQLPTLNGILMDRGCKEMREESDYNVEALKEYLQENLTKLNKEQREIFCAVMDSVQQSKGHIIALDAPGGTGKTDLLSTLLAAVRCERKLALATATSGIAQHCFQMGGHCTADAKFY